MGSILDYEQWKKQYRPLLEENDETIVFYICDEKHEEILKVISFVQESHVWTLLWGETFDNDGRETTIEYLLPGFHYVNRLGYVITENPWNKKGVFVYW